MEKLLILVALACARGDQFIDLRAKIPSGVRYLDLVITVEPAYLRFYIYQTGFPDSIQQCCGNKPTSVLRVPVTDGRFCIRQSRPQIKWTIRALGGKDSEL